MAGSPIVEAFDYEGRQDWVGIMLCPSTVAKQPFLDQRCTLPHFWEVKPDTTQLRLPSLLYKNGGIPFHREDESSIDEPDTFEGYAVLPTGKKCTTVTIQIEKATQALRKLKLVAPGPKSQRKFSNTIRWLEFVWNQWWELENRLKAQ